MSKDDCGPGMAIESCLFVFVIDTLLGESINCFETLLTQFKLRIVADFPKLSADLHRILVGIDSFKKEQAQDLIIHECIGQGIQLKFHVLFC